MREDWEDIYNKMSNEEKQIFDLAVDYGLIDDLDKFLEACEYERDLGRHKNRG